MKNQNHTSHIALHTSQKGITLIALIITIIVMLILVGVTINVALNGGLFSKAETATKATEEKAILEEMLVMMDITGEGKINAQVIIDKMKEKYTVEGSIPNITITGKLGKYKYIVSETEIKIAGNDVPPVSSDFEKYIMGSTGEGRSLMEFDEEGNLIGGIFNGTEFLDDSDTKDVDETETLGVEMLTLETDGLEKVFIYAKYDDKAYKITIKVNLTDLTYKTEKLELIYEPKGNEGKTTKDGWIILYDNGATVEAISPSAMGSLRLGYSATATDEVTKLTEAINSYNNAITTINNYCKTLEGLPENTGVRSVGGTTEISNYFNESDIPEYTIGTDTWFSEYNGKIKKGDMNYEQDLIRMIYWGVEDSDVAYWIAARKTSVMGVNDEIYGAVECCVCHGGDRQISGFDFYMVNIYNNSTGFTHRGYYTETSVRPIITVENI